MRIFCIPGLRLVVKSMYIIKCLALWVQYRWKFCWRKDDQNLAFWLLQGLFLIMLFLEQDFLLAF